MTNLNDIIKTFSADDQQRFITYLERKNKRKDTKNIELFKYLLKNDLDSKELCFKLYNSYKKGAYHALRKRLYHSIIDFIANMNLEEENSLEMQIIKYILASRTFLLHKQYKVAYKILDKAETIAEEHYFFPLLNEIYHTKIQYAYTNSELNIDDLVSKFKDNQKHHYLEDQLNIVYAKLRQTINNMTYRGEIPAFQTLIKNTLEKHSIGFNESMSFKSLYQMIKIVSISAFVTNDYLKIESFLTSTYKSLQARKNKEKQLYYRIQVLYLLANTLFRNKKFDQSLEYLKEMQNYMLQKRNKYFNTFKLKYNLLLALNYNYSNKQDKAIELLESFIISKHPDIEALLDIYLSLVMFYFQSGNFNKARQLFSKFYHTDKWYTEKAGKEWVIKKGLIEILLHIELQNIDFVESRLLSFKRSNYSYLKGINQQRAITYLKFIEDYYKTPENVTSPDFKSRVNSSFEWIETEREDIFVMSFYAWLKSKMDKKGLYITTLNLVKQSQNC